MSGKQLLLDYAEGLRISNPRRKLLLLGLIRRANKHYNMELRVGEDTRFNFRVDPVELQNLLQVSMEAVAVHLQALECEYIEFTANYQNTIDWHYMVSLTPLLRKGRADAGS